MAFYSGIECDKCGSIFGYMSIWTKGSLVKFAREIGWTIGKLHLCPKCKKKKLNDSSK